MSRRRSKKNAKRAVQSFNTPDQTAEQSGFLIGPPTAIDKSKQEQPGEISCSQPMQMEPKTSSLPSSMDTTQSATSPSSGSQSPERQHNLDIVRGIVNTSLKRFLGAFSDAMDEENIPVPMQKRIIEAAIDFYYEEVPKSSFLAKRAE